MILSYPGLFKNIPHVWFLRLYSLMKNPQHDFPKMRGGGLKAVWNFSENSSVLERGSFPNLGGESLPLTWRIFLWQSRFDRFPLYLIPLKTSTFSPASAFLPLRNDCIWLTKTMRSDQNMICLVSATSLVSEIFLVSETFLVS